MTHQRTTMLKIAKTTIMEETKTGFLLKRLNKLTTNPDISRSIEDKNIKRVETKKIIQSVMVIYFRSDFIVFVVNRQDASHPPDPEFGLSR